MRCFCCDISIPNGKKYCNFCEKLYFRDEVIRVVKIKKTKKIPKSLIDIECKTCKKIFKPKNHKQKNCSECKNQVSDPATKWLNNKKRVNSVHSDAVAYSFFRKKDTEWLKKFNSCRG